MIFKYCRYCKKDVPMFDDAEYKRLKEIYLQCIEELKEYHKTHDVPLFEGPRNDLYQPLFKAYKEITGVDSEFDPEEFMRRHYLARWKK